MQPNRQPLVPFPSPLSLFPSLLAPPPPPLSLLVRLRSSCLSFLFALRHPFGACYRHGLRSCTERLCTARASEIRTLPEEENTLFPFIHSDFHDRLSIKHFPLSLSLAAKRTFESRCFPSKKSKTVTCLEKFPPKSS